MEHSFRQPLKSVILDSNIWIAYINPNDSQHQKANAFLESLRGTKLMVPEYVILEVATVLKSKKLFSQASIFVQRILSTGGSQLIYMSNYLNQVIEVFINYAQSDLSFVDCALVALSPEYTIYTFDKKLVKILKKYP